MKVCHLTAKLIQATLNLPSISVHFNFLLLQCITPFSFLKSSFPQFPFQSSASSHKPKSLFESMIISFTDIVSPLSGISAIIIEAVFPPFGGSLLDHLVDLYGQFEPGLVRGCSVYFERWFLRWDLCSIFQALSFGLSSWCVLQFGVSRDGVVCRITTVSVLHFA